MELKQRKCKFCQERFQPVRPMQGLCKPECAYAYAKKLKANKEAKDWRDEKKVLKEKLKTHKDYLKELQAVFNTYIRKRDEGMPCISCDCNMEGRKGDASHYYSVGGNSNLRFDEDNVHLACVPCNQHKHGNIAEYAIRLPFRIGYKKFEALKEKRNVPLKLSIHEIIALKATYKEKLKTLN